MINKTNYPNVDVAGDMVSLSFSLPAPVYEYPEVRIRFMASNRSLFHGVADAIFSGNNNFRKPHFKDQTASCADHLRLRMLMPELSFDLFQCPVSPR